MNQSLHPSGRRRTFLRAVGSLSLAAALLAPAAFGASSSSPSPEEALRNYRRGRFAPSQEQYATLARERPDDPRLRFNAGTAAYRQNDLTNAIRWFESVVGAPDLRLQQQAYYNLGNTRYRLGESLQDPQSRQRLWQEALTNFTAATKLDASDTNAAGNLAYVRQRLEELQQQMPPPPQDNASNDDSKDKSQDPDESKDAKGRQKPKDGQDNSGDRSDPSKDPGQGSDNPGGQEREKPGQPQPGAGKDGEPEPGKDGKEQQEGSPVGNPGESENGQGDSRNGSHAGTQEGSEGDDGRAAMAAQEDPSGAMTPAQAIQILEGQKDDEKALMLRAPGGDKQAERAARVRKPW
ncbi:MAG: hypothetical protein KF791_06765 [Verrucomicrobiae bacterium]|nr:hypothetical protein [Verrucomicrobiae bacterium]